MCYKDSVEGLLSFGIPEITRGLRRKRYTLHKIDSVFTASPDNFVEIPWEWTITTGGYFNRTERKNSVKVYIRKDTSGLYVEIVYSLRSEWKGKTTSPPYSLRYDLVRRESNLKPGTYRYYFNDPYSPKEGGICTRLYLLPELGEFVPRSILDSWRVRYANQKRGHKDRYLHPRKVPSTKYRKSHYRGKETPFWRSFREKAEEEDYREILSLVGSGYATGIVSRENEWKLLQEYCRVTGRKTLPSSPLCPQSRRLYLPR